MAAPTRARPRFPTSPEPPPPPVTQPVSDALTVCFQATGYEE